MSDGPALLPSSDAAFVPGKVSIVVLNWNAAPFVARALDSIVRHTHRPYELIVVDNGSTDESREVIAAFVRAHPHVDVRRIDHATNLRFSRGMNAGIRASAPDARYVVVFCNDVEVKHDDWLDAMIDAVDRGAAVGHVGDGVALARQHEIQDLGDVDVVLDDEDAGLCAHDGDG